MPFLNAMRRANARGVSSLGSGFPRLRLRLRFGSSDGFVGLPLVGLTLETDSGLAIVSGGRLNLAQLVCVERLSYPSVLILVGYPVPFVFVRHRVENRIAVTNM